MSEELNIQVRVEQAVTHVLAREGFELVLCEFVPRQHILRLYIDHANGVSIDDCSRVSHVVGDLLDAEGISDAIPGRYHLEVSSPGLDRPLVRPKDFQRFAGHEATILTREPLSGRKKFTGQLAEAGEREVRIVVDGAPYVIPYDAIHRAKLVPEL